METENLLRTCKEIAKHYYQGQGLFDYEAFEHINGTFFNGELPTPLIHWGLTAHGKCLGWTRPDGKDPIINLHPSLLGGTEAKSPWGEDPAMLGVCYAYDVLIHECIHVSQYYLLDYDGTGDSSHNNPIWVGEVNRIAPLLGYPDVEAETTKIKRLPNPGEKTKTGKPATKPTRINVGNIPYSAVCRFPYALRIHLGETDFYRRRELPFALDLQGLPLRGCKH